MKSTENRKYGGYKVRRMEMRGKIMMKRKDDEKERSGTMLCCEGGDWIDTKNVNGNVW